MHSYTLGSIWGDRGKHSHIRVRFSDWNYEIKWFEIHGFSEDNYQIYGKLDSGEEMSYPSRSNGWEVYYDRSEWNAHPV